MYEASTALGLHRLSCHSLQNRYESDEETVSEPDAGPQDLLSSPVGSPREIFDSDLSADDISDRDERLPPLTKRPRPVSTDSLKRNGGATFSRGAYVLNDEDHMVLELPSPDSPLQLASTMFMQSNNGCLKRRNAHLRSRSPSPSSIFSMEEADIQVAQQVTFMDPRTRPTVVLINALGSRSKGSKSRPTYSRSRESTKGRPTTVRSDSRCTSRCESVAGSAKSPLQEIANPPSKASSTIDQRDIAPSANIKRVSEIYPLPYIPAPSRSLATEDQHPRSSGSERAMPPPLNLRPRQLTETRRPASLRSASSGSLPYTSRPTTPFSPEESIPKTIYDDDSLPSLTRTCSPASIASSPPAKRTVSSTYRVSNILSNRSPLMMRHITRKNSSSSIASLASLRSEFDPIGPNSSQLSIATQPDAVDSNTSRRPRQRRHLRRNSNAQSGRGFLGLKLSKKHKN